MHSSWRSLTKFPFSSTDEAKGGVQPEQPQTPLPEQQPYATTEEQSPGLHSDTPNADTQDKSGGVNLVGGGGVSFATDPTGETPSTPHTASSTNVGGVNFGRQTNGWYTPHTASSNVRGGLNFDPTPAKKSVMPPKTPKNTIKKILSGKASIDTDALLAKAMDRMTVISTSERFNPEGVLANRVLPPYWEDVLTTGESAIQAFRDLSSQDDQAAFYRSSSTVAKAMRAPGLEVFFQRAKEQDMTADTILEKMRLEIKMWEEEIKAHHLTAVQMERSAVEDAANKKRELEEKIRQLEGQICQADEDLKSELSTIKLNDKNYTSEVEAVLAKVKDVAKETEDDIQRKLVKLLGPAKLFELFYEAFTLGEKVYDPHQPVSDQTKKNFHTTKEEFDALQGLLASDDFSAIWDKVKRQDKK